MEIIKHTKDINLNENTLEQNHNVIKPAPNNVVKQEIISIVLYWS